ncbi:hypothetical protein [Methanococcoides sp.]|nr:hypothetical protein [Methanococcoides sp.]
MELEAGDSASVGVASDWFRGRVVSVFVQPAPRTAISTSVTIKRIV